MREIVSLQEKVIDDLVKENFHLKEENASMRVQNNENKIKSLLKENADLKQENDDLKRFQLNPEVVFSESEGCDNRIDVKFQSGATDKKKGRSYPYHTSGKEVSFISFYRSLFTSLCRSFGFYFVALNFVNRKTMKLKKY